MKYLILMFCTSFVYSAYSQSNLFLANHSIFDSLKSFIKSQEQLDSVTFIQVEGLTNDYSYPFKTRRTPILNGIYKLRSGVSHKPSYIFIKDAHGIRILMNYSMDLLIEEYEKIVFKRALNCHFKAKCLENMIDIYNNRLALANGSGE